MTIFWKHTHPHPQEQVHTYTHTCTCTHNNTQPPECRRRMPQRNATTLGILHGFWGLSSGHQTGLASVLTQQATLPYLAIFNGSFIFKLQIDLN